MLVLPCSDNLSIQTALTAECTGIVSTTGASYGGSGAEEQDQGEPADKEVRGNGEWCGERL